MTARYHIVCHDCEFDTTKPTEAEAARTVSQHTETFLHDCTYREISATDGRGEPAAPVSDLPAEASVPVSSSIEQKPVRRVVIPALLLERIVNRPLPGTRHRFRTLRYPAWCGWTLLAMLLITVFVVSSVAMSFLLLETVLGTDIHLPVLF